MAIGYVVVNRFRFYPRKFGLNLSSVIYKPGQFGGVKSDIFAKLASSEYISDKLTYRECQIYTEALLISRKILSDSESRKDPLFLKKKKHGFFFNKASNTPPDSKKSPLILSKTVSGFEHSFYGFNPDA
ncbi:MAG: cell wall hydrolase [Candidatus Riflebacteria bacterium]|nr:cell wall hydrolase [Candidatus Riflebacteria bacterium]